MRMKKKVILLGAGGHAKAVIDAMDLQTFKIIGLIDVDEKHLHEKINNVTIIDCENNLDSYYPHTADSAFVAIGHMGNYQVRNELYRKLKSFGFELVNIIHHDTTISPSVNMGEGNVIMPRCVLNAEVRLGSNSIINTGAIVEHEVSLGNGIHIAPGSIVCGGCTISDNVFVGAGSVIIQGITIGENSIVGAGSVVISDIPANVIAAGVPAKIVKRRSENVSLRDSRNRG